MWRFFNRIKAKSVAGVPSQRRGGFHDTESQKFCNDTSAAHLQFKIIKEKFLAIHEWKCFCQHTLADFSLYNKQGVSVARPAEVGDYVKINIVASPDIGTKYFWVQIETIADETSDDGENSKIVFIPSVDPTSAKKHIAHFYHGKSSSTFMIAREGNAITAAVYGRNETPNLQTDFFNRLRNIFIALSAMAGISKIQWKGFVDGILEDRN